jgi:hypothetical protein
VRAFEKPFNRQDVDDQECRRRRRVHFHGMSLCELQEGRIARYRESFDEGALRQLRFKPESIAKVLGRAASGDQAARG